MRPGNHLLESHEERIRDRSRVDCAKRACASDESSRTPLECSLDVRRSRERRTPLFRSEARRSFEKARRVTADAHLSLTVWCLLVKRSLLYLAVAASAKLLCLRFSTLANAIARPDNEPTIALIAKQQIFLIFSQLASFCVSIYGSVLSKSSTHMLLKSVSLICCKPYERNFGETSKSLVATLQSSCLKCLVI